LGSKSAKIPCALPQAGGGEIIVDGKVVQKDGEWTLIWYILMYNSANKLKSKLAKWIEDNVSDFDKASLDNFVKNL